MSVHHIRPYQVLCIADCYDEEVKFFMPQAQGQGSIQTIDSIMLIKLMRIVDPSFVFEFGTYKGITTRLLLDNLAYKDVEGPRLFTIDLPNLDGVSFQGSDAEVAEEAMNFDWKYLSSKRKGWVKQILQDCLSFSVEGLEKKFQFIFVDGNHELKYVQSDTEKSFEMLAEAPSCIVWHDFGNPEFPELTDYLEQISQSKNIYHIEDTMIAFYLNGKDVAPRKN